MGARIGRGIIAGVPDVFVLLHGIAHMVEIKTLAGKLSGPGMSRCKEPWYRQRAPSARALMLPVVDAIAPTIYASSGTPRGLLAAFSALLCCPQTVGRDDPC